MDHAAHNPPPPQPPQRSQLLKIGTYDNNKQSQVKEKGEPQRNTSISNVKKTAYVIPDP